jgi:hypothetical protein
MPSQSGDATLLAIRTGLRLASGRELELDNPQWLPHAQAKRGLPIADLQGFKIDLGAEVDLWELTLTEAKMVCRGRINVLP